MYLPAHFEETNREVLHRLMHDHPLAMLVTHGAGGLDANHIPFELDPSAGPFGTLRGHLARGNPLWREAAESEVLAVFQGPQRYISPSWYPSKQEGGKVVPTWNYAVVHAHGPLRVIDDPAWLRGLLVRLTAHHEAAMPVPWQVSDAPEEFIAKQLRAIVGIEIPLSRLTGKWKTSQNRNPADRAGVADGLRRAGNAAALAMADLVDAARRDEST
jgi:transcriptional regulator